MVDVLQSKGEQIAVGIKILSSRMELINAGVKVPSSVLEVGLQRDLNLVFDAKLFMLWGRMLYAGEDASDRVRALRRQLAQQEQQQRKPLVPLIHICISQ